MLAPLMPIAILISRKVTWRSGNIVFRNESKFFETQRDNLNEILHEVIYELDWIHRTIDKPWFL